MGNSAAVVCYYSNSLRNQQFGTSVSCIITNLQVLLKDNASLKKDCNVTMEIPVQTTIAYALTELEIKESGCFGAKPFIHVSD